MFLPIVKFIGLPKITRISGLPECSGIHSAQYLLLNNKNYVADFEDVTAFAWYDYRLIRNPLTRGILIRLLRDDRCKRLLPWTDAARLSLENSLSISKEIKSKIETVYPCYVPKRKTRKSLKDTETVRFLFVGRAFYQKGGLDTLIAFSELTKKYDIDLKVISDGVPDEVKKKFEQIKGIHFLGAVARENIGNEYTDSDVFIMPTHFDTFGYVYLEAMGYELPCIGTDIFSSPEIIENNKTGLITRNHCSRFNDRFQPVGNSIAGDDTEFVSKCMNPPIDSITELKEAMITLIEDKSMRDRMGRAGLKEVESGKFSIAFRNRKLKEIYDSSF